ncbi:MAG: hypothetical protein V4591_06485, partial [Bdellovibrionota bacterium]
IKGSEGYTALICPLPSAPEAPQNANASLSQSQKTTFPVTKKYNQHYDAAALSAAKSQILEQFKCLSVSQEIAGILSTAADEFHNILYNSQSGQDFQQKMNLFHNNLLTTFYFLEQRDKLENSNFSENENLSEFSLEDVSQALKNQVKNIITMFFIADIHSDNLTNNSHRGAINSKTTTLQKICHKMVTESKNSGKQSNGFSSFFLEELQLINLQDLSIIVGKNKDRKNVSEFQDLLKASSLIQTQQQGNTTLFGSKQRFILVQTATLIHMGSCDSQGHYAGYGVQKTTQKIITGNFRISHRGNNYNPLPTNAKLKYSNNLAIYQTPIDRTGTPTTEIIQGIFQNGNRYKGRINANGNPSQGDLILASGYLYNGTFNNKGVPVDGKLILGHDGRFIKSGAFNENGYVDFTKEHELFFPHGKTYKGEITEKGKPGKSYSKITFPNKTSICKGTIDNNYDISSKEHYELTLPDGRTYIGTINDKGE